MARLPSPCRGVALHGRMMVQVDVLLCYCAIVLGAYCISAALCALQVDSPMG